MATAVFSLGLNEIRVGPLWKEPGSSQGLQAIAVRLELGLSLKDPGLRGTYPMGQNLSPIGQGFQ